MTDPALFNIDTSRRTIADPAIIGLIEIEVRQRDNASAYLCRSSGLSIEELRSVIDNIAQSARAL